MQFSTPLKVAIVGGGISGLGTAWYLLQRARASGRAVDVTLFEAKPLLGGNADTVAVSLGRWHGGGREGQAYQRWADLGVNDVNLATYHRLRQVMEQIGCLDRLKPLQDTECYHDGRSALTDDRGLDPDAVAVRNPATDFALADGGRLASLVDVVHRAATDRLDEVGPDYTCGRFFDDCLRDPRGALGRAAQQLGVDIDWADPALPARLERVRDQVYYPRISAMYFTDDQRGPAGMPLQAPFEYYRLQEGGGQPDRRYFDGGAQHWLEALEAAIHRLATPAQRFTVRRQARAQVAVRDAGAAVRGGDGAWEEFDLCVMATHADDADAALDFRGESANAGARLREVLRAVRYTRSYAVCHTASAVMPEDRNTWRTYNIAVRSRDDTFFPYRIDYVANLHQNDPVNPAWDRAGLPQFFVSLVDDLNRIPRHDMLDRVDSHEALTPALRDTLPVSALTQLRTGTAVATGYRHELGALPESLDRKAWTLFKHNVLDAACIRAQQAMLCHNQAAGEALRQGSWPLVPVFFGGGWTLGAGLQEQCLEQAEKVAGWVLGG